MADDRYEDRYCAFIDILGFSQLVGELRNDPSRFVEIQQLLASIHEPPKFQVNAGRKQQSDLQAQSISDAIAISTNANDAGLVALIFTVGQLVRRLLRQGYFARGAICKGRLYHDQKTIFGEALIRAYTLESEVARYPRIMIAKEVVDDAHGYVIHRVDQYIERGDDGPNFLHVLRPLQDHLHKLKTRPPLVTGEEEPNLTMYEEMRSRIVQRFAESVDTPRHFEKVQWFARYWNRTVHGVDVRDTVGKIQGPGID